MTMDLFLKHKKKVLTATKTKMRIEKYNDTFVQKIHYKLLNSDGDIVDEYDEVIYIYTRKELENLVKEALNALNT